MGKQANTNPLRRAPHVRLRELSSLRDVSHREGDAVGQAWKKIEQMSQAIMALTNHCELLQRQVDRLRVRKGSAVEGWRWADPKTYDFNKDYEVNEVVVVLKGSLAVTDGLPSADAGGDTVKALAGTWICVKAVRVEGDEPDFTYRVPQWPTPTPDDPDAEENYWQLLPIYPSQVPGCDSSGNTSEFFENAQPKPTPP